VIFDAPPAVVGHRGLGAGQPGGYRENSVASFLAAADCGVPWVELDARRSADGELVLWHDPVTPEGDLIVGRTAEELAAAGIVTLDDVLAALPAGVGVDIDVKTVIEDAVGLPGQRTHALIAAALRRHAGTRRFLVSSFDASVPSLLRQAGGVPGDVALGLITEAGFAAGHAISAAANLGLDAICLNKATVSSRHVIDVAHRAGLEVMVWSPDPAEVVALAEAGADALCVNDISAVQAALARRETR
jgi:glycerophosphoryl diester phosphodiesterase